MSLSEDPDLDRWLASFPEARVRRELAKLRVEHGELQQRMRADQHHEGSLIREIVKRQEILHVWESQRSGSASSAPDDATSYVDTPAGAKAVDEAVPGRPKRGRAAVLAVMREQPDRTWHFDELFDALLARGMTPDDRHAVLVALSRMTREELLDRPKRGVYRLRIPESAGGEPP